MKNKQLEERNGRIRKKYDRYRGMGMTQSEAVTELVRDFSAHQKLEYGTILQIVGNSKYGVVRKFAVRYQELEGSELKYLLDEKNEVITVTKKKALSPHLRRLKTELKVLKVEIVELDEKK